MTKKDVKLVSTEELAEMDAQTGTTSPIFGSYASDVEMPSTKLNHDPIEPRIASEVIREYLGTEGNAHQNLCTFVQTYMEPEATELMKDTLEKNAIDGRPGEPLRAYHPGSVACRPERAAHGHLHGGLV